MSICLTASLLASVQTSSTNPPTSGVSSVERAHNSPKIYIKHKNTLPFIKICIMYTLINITEKIYIEIVEKKSDFFNGNH